MGAGEIRTRKMKTLILFVLPLALFGADQNQKKKEPAAKPAATAPAAKPAAKPAAGPITVPPDATLIASGVWRHTDSSGKTWIYRQTPFGLSRVEEQQIPAAAVAAPPVEVKTTDLGDSIRFEKPTPMGARVWTRQKSELTPEEKEWLAKAAAKNAEK
jgi:hypothetical protein